MWLRTAASWNIAGTVITAARRGRPSARAARLASARRRRAESSSADRLWAEAGNNVAWLVPICRLNSSAVSPGWLALLPGPLHKENRSVGTNVHGRGKQHRSIVAGKQSRAASPSCTAIAELLVPRSIPKSIVARIAAAPETKALTTVRNRR